jgi:hypothetical protein
MDSTTRTLPTLVRLAQPATCGCGEVASAGERVGYLSSDEGIVCLGCMADLQAGRLDLASRAGGTNRTDLVAARRRLTAAEHRAVVATRADDLVHRLDAIRTLGSLHGEGRPIEVFTPDAG